MEVLLGHLILVWPTGLLPRVPRRRLRAPQQQQKVGENGGNRVGTKLMNPFIGSKQPRRKKPARGPRKAGSFPITGSGKEREGHAVGKPERLAKMSA